MDEIIICPWCGCVPHDHDDLEWGTYNSATTQCGECYREFVVQRELVVYYTTTKGGE